MSILRRKVRRDLKRQWAQFAAVALTIGLGLAGFVGARDAFLNLRGSVDQVYSRLRLADLTVTGGDTARFRAAAAELPGQPAVEVRQQADVPLRVGDAKFLGRIVSLPAGGQPAVNRLELLSGRLTGTGVAIEHHLADHHGLAPGDSITVGATTLPVSAVVTSPEYLWPARSRQEIITDPAQFGVVYATPDVFTELAGGAAQTQVSLYATERGQAGELVRDGTVLAARTGAADTEDRSEQPSARAIDDDIAAISDYAVLFPVLFVTAAILATYILLSRLVEAQRETIGTLRACGLSSAAIGRHYLGHAVVTAVLGIVVGILLGLPLGGWFATAYAHAIGLPFTVASLHPTSLLLAAVAGLAAAALAAWTPARAAARTRPAEAMRTTPVTAAPGQALRLLPRRTPMRWRMVIRGLGRNRRRSLFTLTGITLALGLVIVPIGLWDTLQVLLPQQFTAVQREDLQLYTAPGRAEELIAVVRSDKDVAETEPFARSDVTIAAQGRSHPTVLYGYQPGTVMHRFPDGLPSGGIVLPAVLRDTMRLTSGDQVGIALPGRPVLRVTVAGFVDEPLGAFAYTSLGQLSAWTGGEAANGVAVKLHDPHDAAAVAARLARLPGVTATVNTRALQEAMSDTFELYTTLVIIMAAIGAVMAAAIIYTTTSATITERRVEFGTLRAAGMPGGLLARLLAAENMLLAMAGLVPGLLIGWLLARYFMTAYQTDQMHLTLHLRPATLPLIAGGVLLAAGLAQLPAPRHIRHTDIARVVRERSG